MLWVVVDNEMNMSSQGTTVTRVLISPLAVGLGHHTESGKLLFIGNCFYISCPEYSKWVVKLGRVYKNKNSEMFFKKG